MDMKSFAWDYFSKSGSVDALLLYRAETEYQKKAGLNIVSENTGDSYQGNQGGGE